MNELGFLFYLPSNVLKRLFEQKCRSQYVFRISRRYTRFCDTISPEQPHLL